MRILALLSLFAAVSVASPVDQAFERLYNFDFTGAHRIIDAHVVSDPADPLSYVVRASALLFQELDRLQILEGEFFSDDKRFIDKKKIKADTATREQFFRCVNEAERRAKTRLAINSQDADALFTMSLASGLTADYNSMIEKKQWNSFSYLKQSNEFAQNLIRHHPTFTDAYLASGLSEYLIGSLPFFMRWFVKMDGVDGSKDMAAQKMLKVARSGRYLKPFAKILLSIYYLREKKPEQSRTYLVELSRDFPENPLFRKELQKVVRIR
jgi:hypothetical protein